MAFNFNWSPLMADAGFYTRAQDLLTAALNKSPKPPIIVGDIVVTELNLGSVPPELEILEVGDLAEDRFRGIFKMSYSGDAFLTLKTCVQANSMNTYLVTRPSFTSPTPLAAAHGLTIPLQITLSDIKLSGFVILVYSKQKGITLVFRNDPLESLKVSSTFDSIPFVRDYLQKEIEGQLRILFMDELPAIIHRLSLRLWVPEYRGQEVSETQADESSAAGPGQDPLLNPPQDPVDASGNVLSLSQIASLSLDSGVEMHSLFSQKNLLRLATLRDSQRTLSLFTPSIQEVVFRASTGPGELAENAGLISPASPPLTRTHSQASSLYSLQDSTTSSRPPLSSPSFSGYGISMGAGRHARSRPSKKQKRRVVDLRRPKKSDEESITSQDSTYTDSVATSSRVSQPTIPEEQDEDPVTPPLSRENTIREAPHPRPSILKDKTHYKQPQVAEPSNHSSNLSLSRKTTSFAEATSNTQQKAPVFETYEPSPTKPDESIASVHGVPPSMLSFMSATQERSILEQAWMMKLANEVTRRIQDGKSPLNMNSGRRSRDASPPPAYGQ